jgi:hypothetical protein
MNDAIAIPLAGLASEQGFRARNDDIRREASEANGLTASIGWEPVSDMALGTLKSGLARVDGLTLLGRAWAVSTELKKAAHKSLDGQTIECLVPLAKHPLSQKVYPTVSLSCGGVDVDLKFTLQLTAAIECADLVVCEGRLVAIQAGRLTPSAVLSYKTVEIGRKSFAPIDLPERHYFKRGGFQIVEANNSTQ